MIELVICSTCRRHVRAGDAVCPFCGSARMQVSPRPRATRPGHSRAQRYALGAAVAASIGVAKADTPKDGASLAATDADAAVPDADASQPPPPQLEPPHHQGGGPCQRVGGCCNSQVVCPPYGCVFPDDGCDVVHV